MYIRHCKDLINYFFLVLISNRDGNTNKTSKIEIKVPRARQLPREAITKSLDVLLRIKPDRHKTLPDDKIVEKLLSTACFMASFGF